MTKQEIVEDFSLWDNSKVLSLLERVQKEDYGLLVEVTKREDIDRFKRKVWEVQKKHGIPPVNMRINPDMQLQIFVLRVRKDGEENKAQASEAHGQVNGRKPETPV